jgi:hypothetical protein
MRALEGMIKEIKSLWRNGKGEKVTVVSTGPMTNVALFVSCYEDVVVEGGVIEVFVFMGGGVGLGNRSAVAEYNVLTDRCVFFLFSLGFGKLMLRIYSSCDADRIGLSGKSDYDTYQCHSHRNRNS